MLDLTGKAAVVTGATRGIGRAIAESLAAHGANVTLSARKEDAVREAAEEIAKRAKGGRVLGVRCDVRSYDDCSALIAKTVEEFGRLDILINNAGIGGMVPVEEMSPETWRSVIETNLNGMFYCTREAIPHLRATRAGFVINIGSLAGKNAFPKGGAYNASKFGVIGFSEALMQEVRHDDIRVSYIMPGSVATEFFGMHPGTGDDWKIHPEDIAEIVIDLLRQPARTLVSRVEVRPSKPKK